MQSKCVHTLTLFLNNLRRLRWTVDNADWQEEALAIGSFDIVPSQGESITVRVTVIDIRSLDMSLDSVAVGQKTSGRAVLT